MKTVYSVSSSEPQAPQTQPQKTAPAGAGDEESGLPCDAALEFEEAVARTGQGCFHYKLQLICGLGLMATLVEMLSTGYALPAAQCDLNISTQDKGFINAICYVGMLFGSHLWGFLADTRGRRVVLLLTLLADCVCTLVGALAPAVWLLLVARFFNGFFICGSAAVLFAYLGEFHSDRTRARAIVWLGVFVAFATILLPALAWLVIPLDLALPLPWADFRSWRLFLLLCAVPGLVSALLIRALLPRSPKFSLLVGDHEEAMDTLRYIYATNTGADPDTYPVKAVRLGPAARRGSRLGPAPESGISAARSSKSALALVREMMRQTMPLFRRPHLGPNLLACALEFAILCCANGFLLWLPEIFNRLAQYDAEHEGHGLSVCQVIAAHAATVAAAGNGTSAGNSSTAWAWGAGNGTGAAGAAGAEEEEWANWWEPEPEYPTDEPAAPVCSNDMDVGAFQNTLIIGGATALAYILAGSLVNTVGKRNVLISSMVTSGVAGVVLYFMTTPEAVLGVTCVFIGLATMCVSVVNSIVVELFPTKLRAMAVCLSLMCGRLGTVVGSLLVGSLLELSCPSVFFVLSGVILFCGFLGFLVPKEPAPEDDST